MHRANGPKKLSSRSILDSRMVRVGGRDWNVDFTLDDEVAFSQAVDSLRHYLSQSRGWFTGGAVTVNVGRRILNQEELSGLRQVLEEEFRVKIARFWCEAETLERAISYGAGVPVELEPKQRIAPSMDKSPQPHEAPLLIKSTCRSGTTIRHNGDVIVMGDVNPGAQVTAAGDMIVLGTLRGTVHAGADDTDPTESVIIALSLQPLQLRIGQHVSIAPTDSEHDTVPSHPEIAYVSENSIIVAPYTGGLQRTMERNIL